MFFTKRERSKIAPLSRLKIHLSHLSQQLLELVLYRQPYDEVLPLVTSCSGINCTINARRQMTNFYSWFSSACSCNVHTLHAMIVYMLHLRAGLLLGIVMTPSWYCWSCNAPEGKDCDTFHSQTLQFNGDARQALITWPKVIYTHSAGTLQT